MPEQLSDTDYTSFRTLILTRTGLDFPPPRRADFNAWLRRALDMLHDMPRAAHPTPVPTTFNTLYNALLTDDLLVWDTVIDALTICETHFFRNAPQFDAIRDYILPDLIEGRRTEGSHTLRLWSAGCASGEEAYSLAILLREVLPDWKQWSLDILGTDINKHSLNQARQAVYRDWSFREAYAQTIRGIYFEHHDNRYHLHDDVRQMVRFMVCSLIERCEAFPPDTQGADIILCRNVTLYLGEPVRDWVYQQLKQALAPGGWLIIGHADPQPPTFIGLEAHTHQGVTIYRKPHTAKLPSAAPSPLPRLSGDTLPIIPPLPPDDSYPTSEDSRHDAHTHYRLGRWHANRQHWQEALYHCLRAVEIAPTYTEVYYTLGLIYQSMGSVEDAIEALRRVVYLQRDWALPRFTLAGIYRENGRTDQARRELRNVIAITGKLPADTPIIGGDGLTAARLQDAAERQLAALPAESPR